MSETVKIIPSVLREQVEAGWKKKALAEHYGLPVTQMTTALKQLGLTIRKFHAPKFEFVEEEVEQVEEQVEVVSETVETEVEAVEESMEVVAEMPQAEESTATNADW